MIALALCLLAQLATAEEKRFYDTAKKGWFWYEEPAPDVEAEKEPPLTPRSVPSLANYSTEQLWEMHPDDFQALLMEFQKKAVQWPTEETVHEYLTMQDIARRKAAAYANVASYVIQKYADLDVGRGYRWPLPAWSPGSRCRKRK